MYQLEEWSKEKEACGERKYRAERLQKTSLIEGYLDRNLVAIKLVSVRTICHGYLPACSVRNLTLLRRCLLLLAFEGFSLFKLASVAPSFLFVIVVGVLMRRRHADDPTWRERVTREQDDPKLSIKKEPTQHRGHLGRYLWVLPDRNLLLNRRSLPTDPLSPPEATLDQYRSDGTTRDTPDNLEHHDRPR